MSYTGGVLSGWRGLPIPFYSCGMWGDTFRTLNQCEEGLYEPASSCPFMVVKFVLIVMTCVSLFL